MEFYTEKLRKIRKQQRLSAEALAVKMGINRTTLCRWEYGQRIPSEASIRMLAKILNISVSDISDLAPEKPVSSIQYSDAIQSWISIAVADPAAQDQKIALLMNGISHLNKDLRNTKLIIDALLASVSSIFYIKDKNLDYIVANRLFLENLSLNPAYSVINKTDYDFFISKEAKQNEEQDQKVLHTGESMHFEDYIPGSRRKKWGIIAKIPVFDHENKIAGLVSSFVDITERKRAEYMRELLEHNINLMQAAISIYYTEKNQFLYLNQGVEDIFGYKLEKFYNHGREFWLNTCVHPDDRKKQRERINSDKDIYDEYRIIKPDGKIRWLNVNYSTRVFDGKQCMLAISQDITDKVKAEKQRKTLESVINSAEDVFWVAKYDREKNNLKYLFINNAVKELYKITDKDDKSFEEYSNLSKNHNQLLIDTPSEKFPLSINGRITRSDGVERQVNRRIFKQADGDIYFGITCDVTDQKRIEEEKEILYNLLSKSDDIIGIFDIDLGKYIYINDTVEKFTGFTAQELYNDPDTFFEYCHDDHYKAERNKYLKNGNWPEKNTFRLIHKDGTIRMCEVRMNISNVFRRRCAIFITRDVTEKAEQEQTIKYLQCAMDSESIAVSFRDLKTGKYLFISHGIKKVFGYTAKDFYDSGTDLWINKMVYKEDRPKILSYLQKKKWPESFEYRIVKPNGELRWVESTTSQNEYLKKPCLVTINKDITDRVNCENENRQLKEELAKLRKTGAEQ